MVLLYFGAFVAKADSGDEAIRAATKAASQIPEVKERMQYVERMVFNRLPIEKDTAAILGGVTFTLIDGKVGTKVFKNLDVDFLGGTIRPDFEYNMRDSSTEAFINCKWDINKLTD